MTALSMTPEMLREYSARELAKLVGRSPEAISKDLEHIPAAWRDKRNWHCPLWAYQQFQEERGRDR